MAACVGRDASSSSSDVLVTLRNELEAQRDNGHFASVEIHRITAGLSLPSWIPKVVQKSIGSEDAYLPVPLLVRETLQNTGDTENILGLEGAIARVPQRPQDDGLRCSGLQAFALDGNSTGNISSTRRKAELARKRAELASITEQRVAAELEALEAEDEAEATSRCTDDSRDQLADRLAMIGLGMGQQKANDGQRLAQPQQQEQRGRVLYGWILWPLPPTYR